MTAIRVTRVKLIRGMIPSLKRRLEQQGYHILGERGAFKACQWQRKSLLEGKTCYKQRFYGIQSHRCVQMTPVVDKCTHQCVFCWRTIPSDIGEYWEQTIVQPEDVLGPKELLDATLKANLKSLGGYNPKIKPSVPEKKYQEARKPKHVAISLAGEPTLYPLLSQLIEEIHRRGMTSFLVTNGSHPEVLKDLTPPTQLYITLAAPDEITFKKVCRPFGKRAWKQLLESQELLNSWTGRTANRLTMVYCKNMKKIRSYAKLIVLGEPDFVEVKGYMFLGSSRNRLQRENAPPHREIRSFANKLSALTGYHVKDEQVESRVVLLTRKKKVDKITWG